MGPEKHSGTIATFERGNVSLVTTCGGRSLSLTTMSGIPSPKETLACSVDPFDRASSTLYSSRRNMSFLTLSEKALSLSSLSFPHLPTTKGFHSPKNKFAS